MSPNYIVNRQQPAQQVWLRLEAKSGEARSHGCTYGLSVR